jgi:hypothetical protein
MKYYHADGSAVELARQDFIAQGGEGQIFGKGDWIFKIYFDPDRVIPAGKIAELQRLRSPNILVPRALLFDRKHVPVGITMGWVRSTIPLCRLFTSAFRRRRGVEPHQTLRLVENMRAGIDRIHRCDCLMVDGNEFNYLVDDNDLTTPYFIDVDSYQTPGYPATAVMATVKDFHQSGFSTATDWFAFGVVACQLFVGIHPYKGRHPDYGKNELERRMRDNVSIFNPGVSLPSAARALSSIPAAYRNWFEDLFERSRRRPPPEKGRAVISLHAQPATAASTAQLMVRRLRVFDAPLTNLRVVDGVAIVRAGAHTWVGRQRIATAVDAEVVLTDSRREPLVVSRRHRRLSVVTADGKPIHPVPVTADSVMVVDNTLYILSGGHLLQAAFSDTGRMPVMSIRNRWPVLPNATSMFDGVLVENVMGLPFLMIPLPGETIGRCIQIKVPELTPFRIIEARHDRGVCMLLVNDGGGPRRLELKFDRAYQRYAVRMVPDADPGSVNFITLDNGMVVSAPDDTFLEVFHRNPRHQEIRRIRRRELSGPMVLARDGRRVLFMQANTLFQLTMAAPEAGS